MHRSRWFCPFVILALLFFSSGGWLWWWSAEGADLDSMQRLVRRRFPAVRQISTADLARWLSSGEQPPLLFDVREAAEYAVSHLAGARRIAPDAKAAALARGTAKDTPIVTYCSVGYRSSEFAQRLKAAGFSNVQNLEGSIFKWANEDRPLVRDDGKAAEKVHPYSDFWSRLVKPERRAEMPRDK